MSFELPAPGERWQYFTAENAPPDAPAWMVLPREKKEQVWEWQGKRRILRHAMPDPFESIAELSDLIAYLEHHPDFIIVHGRFQAQVRPEQMQIRADGRIQFSFSHLPDEPDAECSYPLERVHRPLYICQRPYTPIPRKNRFWLKTQTSDHLRIQSRWISPLLEAYERAQEAVSPQELIARQQQFLKNYGPEILKEALTDPSRLLTFFLGTRSGQGLYYELEHGSTTKGFGSIRGGSAHKFVVWRSGNGFRKRGPSRDPIPCSAEEAIQLLTRIATTLLGAVTKINNEDIYSIQDVEDPQLPLLHLGWVHKYLALVTDTLSYHHQLHSLRTQLEYLTEQKIPENRWTCDQLWRELFEQTPEFREAHPALLMLACYDVFTPTESDDDTDDSDLAEVIDPMHSSSQRHMPFNTILYGPPGTGKTYETARRAVEIIDGSAPSDRKELMARYRAVQREGRIGFVTFHQSYAYEDFIEGIRPVMDEEAETSGTPRYQIVDGILKELALEALGDALEQKASVATPSLSSFPFLWEALKQQIAETPDKTYPGLTATTKYELQVTQSGRIQGKNINNPSSSSLSTSKIQMEQVWEKYAPTEAKISTTQAVAVLGQSINASLIAGVYLALKALSENSPPETVSILPTHEEKALDFLARGDDSAYALQANPPRYVLIVDEINRGNISKILGELITLLEDDKRIGKDNELTVTLPYSRQPFALPPNLYLIGTMNTADKSLALLDVALRRRFTFEELTPDFGVCKFAPEMRKALEELNRRITLRKDRDHRIGHAFFMNIGTDSAAFNRAFTGKVLPLLQEYFFNDWAGLRDVLGEKDNDPGFIVKLDGADNRFRNQWQWATDAGQPINPLEQLKENYGID